MEDLLKVRITGNIDQEYDKFFDFMDRFCMIETINEIDIENGIVLEFEELPLGAYKYIENNVNIDIVEKV